MVNIFPRHKATTDPLFNGTGVTNGDMLSVFYMLITSMFIFEVRLSSPPTLARRGS